MVLLKIFLLILISLTIILFLALVGPIMTVVIWERIQIKRATRKMIKFMKKSEDFSKLCSYAKSQGIKFMVKPLALNGWGVFSFHPKIIGVGFFDQETIYNPAFQTEGKIAFAHEVAHVEYWIRRKEDTHLIRLSRKYPESYFDCFWEEWWAWLRGKVILDALKISIDEKEYWQKATECVPAHTDCPSWKESRCLKAPVIRKIEERAREKAL